MALPANSVTLFLLCLVAGVHSDHDAPTFIINLDLPARERYTEIGKIYADKWPILLEQISDFMNISDAGMKMSYIFAADSFQYMPQPYRDEMLGFALSVNRTVGEVTVFNMFLDVYAHKHSYDMSTGICTSIITEDSSGTIYHGRNLDYLFQVIRDIVVRLEFQSRGKTLYTGTTFAGYVGLITGQKPNKFTISLNERSKGAWQLNDFAAMRTGTTGIVSFLIRDVLADPSSDFNKAVERFSSTPLIAPCYLIVGGTQPGEGVLITRNRNNSADVLKLDTANGRWFIVETNYDHWEATPPLDPRRDVAIKAMNQLSGDVDPSRLYSVLSIAPVLNNYTMHTTIMSAANPELYYSVIRENHPWY